jgi:hypothetical protein
MKMRTIIGFGLLAGVALLQPAFANAPEGKSPAAAPALSVAAQIGEMGYDLQSAHQRYGRYHANLLDRDTGKVIHAEFRADDGELLSARLLAKDEERRDKDGERSDADRREGHRKADDRD